MIGLKPAQPVTPQQGDSLSAASPLTWQCDAAGRLGRDLRPVGQEAPRVQQALLQAMARAPVDNDGHDGRGVGQLDAQLVQVAARGGGAHGKARDGEDVGTEDRVMCAGWAAVDLCGVFATTHYANKLAGRLLGEGGECSVLGGHGDGGSEGGCHACRQKQGGEQHRLHACEKRRQNTFPSE